MSRHCERSEAIQTGTAAAVWIASSLSLLAMTAKRRGTDSPMPVPLSAIAEQLVDAALQLLLLLFAAAQPRIEVALGRVANHGAEGEANAVGLAPDQMGEKGASLARNLQVHL